MNKIALTTLALFTGLSGFSQGRVDGFFKGKGNLDIAIGGGAEFANEFYAGTNKISLSRTIVNGSIFMGVGVLNNLDVYASAPVVSINNVTGLQDGSIFLKYRLFEKSLTKGQFSASIAAGYSTNLTDYQTEGLNAIGQQATILDIRPVIHYFSNSGWFGTFQAAYNFKSEPTPEALNAALKIGRASAKHYFDFWYDHQTSFGGSDYRGTPTPSTFKELGVDYHKVGATYYKSFSNIIGIYTGLSYVLTGRNIGKGTGVSLGVVIKPLNRKKDN